MNEHLEAPASGLTKIHTALQCKNKRQHWQKFKVSWSALHSALISNVKVKYFLRKNKVQRFSSKLKNFTQPGKWTEKWTEKVLGLKWKRKLTDTHEPKAHTPNYAISAIAECVQKCHCHQHFGRCNYSRQLDFPVRCHRHKQQWCQLPIDGAVASASWCSTLRVL